MPSKIVGKIKAVWAKDGTSRTMLIPCDDWIYTASSLASAIGIHVSSLLGRAERHGWHSKAIVKVAKQRAKDIGAELRQETDAIQQVLEVM